ncbi:MAG TPA: hypothetical protein PLN69_11460 [bacterium]|nr:hypothetical protein [bacterium]
MKNNNKKHEKTESKKSLKAEVKELDRDINAWSPGEDVVAALVLLSNDSRGMYSILKESYGNWATINTIDFLLKLDRLDMIKNITDKRGLAFPMMDGKGVVNFPKTFQGRIDADFESDVERTVIWYFNNYVLPKNIFEKEPVQRTIPNPDLKSL